MSVLDSQEVIGSAGSHLPVVAGTIAGMGAAWTGVWNLSMATPVVSPLDYAITGLLTVIAIVATIVTIQSILQQEADQDGEVVVKNVNDETWKAIQSALEDKVDSEAVRREGEA